MAAETDSQKMSCADLLSHVQRLESMLPVSSAAYFGHPPPPGTHVIELLPDGNLRLGAATTKRCVSAQLWGDNVSEGGPFEVLCLMSPEEEVDAEQEEITCATVVALDPAIKGSDSSTYVSIVVGTSFNRVISMEIEIVKDENGVFSLHVGLPPFEPLPLDSSTREGDHADDASVASMTSDASSRHGTRERSNSQHGSPRRSASLSTFRHSQTPNRKDSDNDKQQLEFCPSGTVTSITPYRASLNDEESLTPILWIAYGDGTTVRLHRGALFSSVVHDPIYYDSLAKAALRSRVMLPPTTNGVTVLPLPKYHPSPLAPLPPWKPPSHEDDTMDSPDGATMTSDDGDGDDPHDEDEDEIEDSVPEFLEAIAYGGEPTAGTGEQFPALVFYTSEKQFVGRIASGDDLRVREATSNDDAALLDHVIGGTTALVSGVVGSAIGVVKWGFGHGDSKKVRACFRNFPFNLFVWRWPFSDTT